MVVMPISDLDSQSQLSVIEFFFGIDIILR
jgi:hypothetical protein